MIISCSKSQPKSKKGFTMVEFSIATAFISVLLIAIAIITSNIITVYQKGLAVKAVNSVGRGLIDEFTSAINQAPSVDTTSLCSSHLNNSESIRAACKKDAARYFIFQHKLGSRNAPGGEGTSDVQLGGVFCTGRYSYIWNTYYGHEAGAADSIKLRYLDRTGGIITTPDGVRLLRFEDPTYLACSVMTDKNYNPLLENASYDNLSTVIDITTLANGGSNPIETPTAGFLTSFDLDLELYEFTIFPISQDQVTLRTFMSGTFILATDRGNINLARSGDYCDIKNLTHEGSSNLFDMGAEFNYCGINKFNFAGRTAGF